MIAGVFGNLSSGKSLLCVKVCFDNFLKSKTKIISNIELNFPYTKMSLPEMIDNTREDPEKFMDCILFVDEIHTIVDARRSGSDLNQKFTQFITQIGKLRSHLIFTSQIFSSQIDLRIRELADLLFFCERVTTNGEPLFMAQRILNKPILIKVVMVIKRFGGALMTKKTFYFDPSPYFDKYNTYELVILDRDKYLKK